MKIAFYCHPDADQDYFGELQDALQLPVVSSDQPEQYSHLLRLDPEGLGLERLQQPSGQQQQQATRVDFLDAGLQYRQQSTGKQQGIAKAVGLNRHAPMHVMDATAGLGRDAFILASLGCRVSMLESSMLVYCLLRDGISRAVMAEGEIRQIMQGMQLEHGQALEYFQAIQNGSREKPDVIYLDPMFPVRQKSAAVKKDMSILQEILPLQDESAFAALLQAARDCAVKRVVVKRPGSKKGRQDQGASFIVPGKAAHFSVYV
ncbi:MAG: 16S rRNA methyltransferase [Gammaproteobacteria bacterium]|nr:16S rRNA methyltransferase [Gammaproteobacteria bacterium]|tara:strand:- start:2108 stop:2890 length:783 start_codon:yes stop_codon:yes gene_type:complete